MARTNFIDLAHFLLHVGSDRLIKRRLDAGEFVIGRVGATLGEQWRAVEFEQFLLHHAAHKIRGINLVSTVAKLAVEAVGIEQ